MKTEMTTEQAILLYRTIETMTKQFDADNKKQLTPITDSCTGSADRFGDRDVIPATIARKLEVMCQELVTELELEQNPGHRCSVLREWDALNKPHRVAEPANNRI